MVDVMNKWNAALQHLTSWILPIMIAVGIAFICSRYFYQFLLIQGESMSPTYHHLQMVVLDKRNAVYDRGDVIAFRCVDLDAVLVKRIAGIPGDEVWIDGGTLYINGSLSHIYDTPGIFEYAGLLEKPLKLGTSQYCVIGDNVSQSKNSRYTEVGVVAEASIIGRVVGGKIACPAALVRRNSPTMTEF